MQKILTNHAMRNFARRTFQTLSQTNGTLRSNVNNNGSSTISAHGFNSTTWKRPFARRQSSWPVPSRPTPGKRRPAMQVTSDGYKHFGQGSAKQPRSPLFKYGAFAMAGGAGYYVYSMIDYAPFTGRMRLIGVSRSTEMQLGKQAFEDLQQSFEGAILPAHHRLTRRVRSVVQRLAQSVQQLDGALCKGFDWTVVVADVDEPNAMCVPGGRMLITTGLLDILHSDDDIAVILGHEIAHAVNRHSMETMSTRRILGLVVMVLNQILDMRMMPSLLASVLVALPYSRKLEHEADAIGLRLCAEACFDARVAPEVFGRLGNLQEDAGSRGGLNERIGGFLSTHPQTNERAARMEAGIPQVMQRFNEKCVQRESFDQLWGDYTGMKRDSQAWR